MMEKKQLTTAAGRPLGDNQNSLTVGPRGPVVFEDFLLFEKMAHFNRERIPERVVHAKGSGAYGYFVCTKANMPCTAVPGFFPASASVLRRFCAFQLLGRKRLSRYGTRSSRFCPQVLYRRRQLGHWWVTTPRFFSFAIR